MAAGEVSMSNKRYTEEFKIEAIELSILSIAKANKKAGKKVPTNPFNVK